MRYQLLPGSSMPDILIRGLTASEIQSLDRLAALQGHSRNAVVRDLIRRSLRASAPIDPEEARGLFDLLSDLGDESIMSQAWR